MKPDVDVPLVVRPRVVTRDQPDEQRPQRPEGGGEEADPAPPAREAAEIRDRDDRQRDEDEREHEADPPAEVVRDPESERPVRQHHEPPDERPAEHLRAAERSASGCRRRSASPNANSASGTSQGRRSGRRRHARTSATTAATAATATSAEQRPRHPSPGRDELACSGVEARCVALRGPRTSSGASPAASSPSRRRRRAGSPAGPPRAGRARPTTRSASACASPGDASTTGRAASGGKSFVKAPPACRDHPLASSGMPTAVVTGGAGFLGSHLCDKLVGEGLRVICVDNLETGSLQNVEHLRGDSFAFVNHDVTAHLEIDEPVDFVFHLASPASPIDYLRLPLADAQGRLVRDAQRARAREVQARTVPARVDERGVRRSRRPSAAGDVLGQRQPDRPARRVRRGEALRGGADDGVPPPAGRRHVHRPDLQHLRHAHAPARRARDPDLRRGRRSRTSRSPSSATARRRGASATSTTWFAACSCSPRAASTCR